MSRSVRDVPARFSEGPAGPRLLRTINDRAALDLFLEHGALSRSDLARMTGISKPTASQILVRLEEAALVLATERTSGRPGRFAQLYELNPQVTYAAALVVTPESVSARVHDIIGNLVGEHRLGEPPRGSGSGPATGLRTLDAALATAGLVRDDLGAVVVAVPAAYDERSDQLLYARGVPGWKQPGTHAELQSALSCPVVVENDVTLAAVAEQRTGAASGIDDFFLMWIDEGVGGAVVIDGRLHRGFSGGAGELAYLPLPKAEELRRPALDDDGGYQRWLDPRQIRRLAASHGVPGRTPQRIISTAAADPAYAAFLDELAERYALALSTVIAVLDPEALVLAGRYVVAGGAALQQRIEAALGSFAIRVPTVLTSAFASEEAFMEGARQVALDRARERAFASA